MPEYTSICVVAVLVVLVLDLWVARTRLVRTRQFWFAYAICAFFQSLMDGWLTKLSAPIVNYAPEEMLGLRFPWDIPVEDFLFGFAMILLTLIVWCRITRRTAENDPEVRTDAAR